MKRREKPLNRIMVAIVCLSLCMTQWITAFAADATITGLKVNLNTDELTVSSNAQTVTATIDLELTGGDMVGVRGADYKLSLPQNWALESYTFPEGVDFKTANTTVGMWAFTSGSANIKSLATLVIGIPAGTSAGDYSISVSSVNVSDVDVNSLLENGTATATLRIKDAVTPATEGYTVSLSPSATSVEKGSEFKVNLDVTSSDKTTFNAFYAELSYDKDYVEYAGEKNETVDGYKTVNGYSVKVESNTDNTKEKLIIERAGEDIQVSVSPNLELPFKAKATTGSTEFSLIKANVDVANNASTDANKANVGDPVIVAITEPAPETYTVTFNANSHGTAPQVQTVESGKKAMDPGELTAEGWTFGGWYKEAECTTAWNFDEDTVTGNVTLYAKWTEIKPLVNAEAITIGDNPYLKDYILIKATIANADGNVPTYGDEAMYPVTNVEGSNSYDSASYYYVVESVNYDLTKVGYGKAAENTISKTGDANQTGTIDINDAQFIYNLYNSVQVTYSPTAKQLLASDVNGNGSVDMNDCAAAIAAIPVQWS